MDVYTTEQEQVEMIKKWLREYGATVVIGAVLGLAGIYGWRYWQALENQKRESASVAYEATVKALADASKKDEGTKLAETLVAEQGDSGYAGLTRLHLAKVAVEANKLDEAAKHLRAVADKPANAALGHIARLRLARVLHAQNKGEEAISLLAAIKEPGDFRASYEETKGDIYKALGKAAEARAAYQAAKAAKPADFPENRLLDMKLDDMPAAQVAAAAGSAK
ncbi:MAG: tetratricopeptide repeat protein [Gammaproteobacteria bacterium]|nr:tetratricopeptide repeat protein [Gammaproteobacteria bacterium]